MSYAVKATRWEGGWELHIDGVAVTQSHTLADAEETVRDYLIGFEVAGAGSAAIEIVPDLGDLTREVRSAREATQRASRAQKEAAVTARAVVKKLRKEGLSVTDTAVTMGISRGRVSQLSSH